MRRFLSALAVFLAAALICAGAVLPGIVDHLTPEVQEDAVLYAEIPSVALDITRPLSITGKLVLMGTAEALTISDTQASRTPEEIDAMARGTLAQLQEAGLAATFEPELVEIRPTMCVDLSDPSLHCIAWSVIITGEAPAYDLAMLTIDDETGAVLSMSYNTKQIWFAEGTEFDRAAQLFDLYFLGLGLKPEPIESSLDYCTLMAMLRSEELGWINVHFSVFESGFSISFEQ